jgi:hypothetical protein
MSKVPVHKWRDYYATATNPRVTYNEAKVKGLARHHESDVSKVQVESGHVVDYSVGFV